MAKTKRLTRKTVALHQGEGSSGAVFMEYNHFIKKIL